MIQKICNLDLNAIRLQVLCALVVVFIACKSILICLDICSICQNMTRNNREKIHPCKRSVHIRGTEGSNKSYWFQCFWFRFWISELCVLLEIDQICLDIIFLKLVIFADARFSILHYKCWYSWLNILYWFATNIF